MLGGRVLKVGLESTCFGTQLVDGLSGIVELGLRGSALINSFLKAGLKLPGLFEVSRLHALGLVSTGGQLAGQSLDLVSH